ncbi:MAG TPA: AAA family ATPase, partial [Candidatus Saccharimonadia bacterium]|nr:AAA family ATPase [Candidatus Saccharimonadia bacterium]
HAVAQVWRPLYRWTITEGLKRLDLDADQREVPPDATATLQAIKDERERGIYLLCDFHPYLRYPMTLRLVREILARDGSAEHTLVLIAPKLEDLPPEIAAAAVRYAPKLPDEAALAKLVRDEGFAYAREHAGRRAEIDAAVLATIARNLIGLSLSDARRVARTLIHDDGVLDSRDLPALGKAKFELLSKDGLLHFELDTASFADVAGIARVKHWVAQRRAIFSGERQVAGLDPPKGVLLLGVQGCGKSLAAKAIAGGFGVPLVRLDFGTLYNKFHGETERNLRAALGNAELLAPCVLWIDEIEKGLATGDADDGVSRRVLGYLLTWMAERKKPVFLVATANQVQHLPPELLRKGRFDEIFFVDLPSEVARAEIFRVHLAKRGVPLDGFDLAALARACTGFSGAEIEQAIVSGLYAAHADGLALSQRHVATELAQTRPLSVLMAEQVEALRAWARERTVPAD